MSLTQSTAYHGKGSSRRLRKHGWSGTAVLTSIGDRELPDATITEARRRDLKEDVRLAEARLSSHQLMFLSCAYEDAARRKRAGERCALAS